MSRWLVSRYKDPVQFNQETGGWAIMCGTAGAAVEVLGHVDAPTRGAAIMAAALKWPSLVRADNVFVDPLPEDMEAPAAVVEPEPVRIVPPGKQVTPVTTVVAGQPSSRLPSDPYADDYR